MLRGEALLRLRWDLNGALQMEQYIFCITQVCDILEGHLL